MTGVTSIMLHVPDGRLVTVADIVTSIQEADVLIDTKQETIAIAESNTCRYGSMKK